MKIGKLSNEDLENYVIKKLYRSRKEVLSGSNIGTDTAILDFADNLIVASTDPITAATKDVGKLAINVSCNDLACQAAEPVAVLMTLLLPPDSELEELNKIIEDANNECEKLNLNIVGGHTEITDAVNRIVVITTALGKSKKEELPKKDLIKVGDVVAISKYIAIEGTSIIYNEKKDELDEFLDNKDKEEILEFSKMLSVLEESSIASSHKIKFMHDITEGGLFGALWETSKSINKKIELELDKVPVKDISKKLASKYNIDLYKLISSGSMIFILSEEDFEPFKNEAKKIDILISKIGHVEEGENLFVKGEKSFMIENETVDEIYSIV